MAITQPVFINTFQKGASENANIGFGTFLGVETYSKKGVARLTKDTVKVSGSVVTDLPIYFCNQTETVFYAQGDTGKVYKSTDTGATWTDISPGTLGTGKGLVFFDGYLYAFRAGAIDYYNPGSGTWTQNWKTGLSGNQNFPFIYPSAFGFYFTNGYKVGLLRQANAGTAIDPATSGTYLYSSNIFELPSIYEITCLSFLTPNLLAMGTQSSGVGNDTQIADIITWDTISKNKFSPPLRLYSNAGTGVGGVKQLINRNNVLYAVTGGNGAIFQTNGTSFVQIAELGLRTNYRKITGEQATAPVFLDGYPSAIAMLGNKLLSGVSTSIDTKPDNSYALYPLGVWSIAFLEDDMAVQCEFPISTGTVRSNAYKIGAIHTISENRILIGYNDNGSFGIDRTSTTLYQNDITTVAIESAMLQIGTPLNPATPKNIELQFVRNLISGQTVTLYARNGFDQPYTLLETFTPTPDGSYKSTKNPIGASQYLQTLIQMKTGGDGNNTAWTPELRNVVIS